MHKVWLSYVTEGLRDMQLLHFRNLLLSGTAAAIFGDGGSELESKLHIVKALCINQTIQNLCKTFAQHSRGIG